MLELNEQDLIKLGQRLSGLFKQYEGDRKAAEDRWLRNLRQFRGIYDPEILAMIPKNCSKAYPKLTRWKVIGTVARLMQMLWPQTEKNWGIKPSPLPDLSKEQLQQVLDKLVAMKSQGDPNADVDLTEVEIEQEALRFATSKAERMTLKLQDDLDEMEFITLARKVVFSAVLYNIGILKGPMHLEKTVAKAQKNPYTGKWEVIESKTFKPLYEFLPVWNYYPDMAATALDKQDGTFERHVMARWQVEELSSRPDFIKANVDKWLQEHRTGNATAKHWETAMKAEPKSDKATISGDGRKYEVIFYYGSMTGHELKAAGVAIAEEELGKSFQAHAALIDNVVLKARLAPLGSDVRQHHEFMFEEDDLSLLGNGQCDTLRDSQLSVCETVRAALDNASLMGFVLEVNRDLLVPGSDVTMEKHKVFEREGEGAAAGVPAIRDIPIDSHLPDLIALAGFFKEFADNESGLPPPSLGDVSGGGSEALRTQQNASMFLGAAALPIRDTVRNYDAFTMSVINGLVKWNRKYAPNESRDGDFNVIARGSTSLIAKEVLGVALDNFRATLAEDEIPHIKTRKLLEFRAKAHDIPIEEILEDEKVAEEKIAAQAQAAQQAQQVQEKLTAAQTEKFLSGAFLDAAKASATDATLATQAFQAFMDVINKGDKNAIDKLKAENMNANRKTAAA